MFLLMFMQVLKINFIFFLIFFFSLINIKKEFTIKKMNKNLKIGLIVLAVIIAVYAILVAIKKSKNPSWLNWLPGVEEQEFFRYRQTEDELQPMESVPMRPNLANAAPVYGRFDANQLAANLTSQASAPMDMLAAPPSGSPLDAETFQNVDFQSLGGAAAPIPAGGLTTGQVNDMLRDKIGSGTPEMQETKDLLPVPDMRYTTGLDPTDPQNFMYDRTIFGRLKRRYGNGVDFFRGDIDVKPQYRGWFDLQPPTETDVVRGYFENYIDIEQETAVRDAVFDRVTPIESLYQASINPGGKTYLTRYDHY
jgi:hypothetical protein